MRRSALGWVGVLQRGQAEPPQLTPPAAAWPAPRHRRVLPAVLLQPQLGEITASQQQLPGVTPWPELKR